MKHHCEHSGGLEVRPPLIKNLQVGVGVLSECWIMSAGFRLFCYSVQIFSVLLCVFIYFKTKMKYYILQKEKRTKNSNYVSVKIQLIKIKESTKKETGCFSLRVQREEDRLCASMRSGSLQVRSCWDLCRRLWESGNCERRSSSPVWAASPRQHYGWPMPRQQTQMRYLAAVWCLKFHSGVQSLSLVFTEFLCSVFVQHLFNVLPAGCSETAQLQVKACKRLSEPLEEIISVISRHTLLHFGAKTTFVWRCRTSGGWWRQEWRTKILERIIKFM